ncbi:DUF2510 domain-containing protein [Gulosibacter sp. 10]|uniref:DUF2510 domain-containing protein n=1 Tax=Gulosibacter sp. 10 TaxID=1255570 RepID=UPI000B357B1F|nr:DUF2510 domain-containing protein [Gulosibacter sp. 10]
MSYPSPNVNRPAPGWHPDRNAPGMERWWDGVRWTEHCRPIRRPQVQAARAQPVASPVPASGSIFNHERDVAAGKNSPAAWGLVMGVASIVLGFIPASITLFGPYLGAGAMLHGMYGYQRAKASGAGMGMAIAAIVLGGIGSLGIIYLVWLLNDLWW